MPLKIVMKTNMQTISEDSDQNCPAEAKHLLYNPLVTAKRELLRFPYTNKTEWQFPCIIKRRFHEPLGGSNLLKSQPIDTEG